MKKSDNKYTQCEDEEETYAYWNETLCNKTCSHVRLFINYVLCQECNNCQERNNHALCQECNNYQQLKLFTKNARSTSNSSASAAASNTSVSSTKGSGFNTCIVPKQRATASQMCGRKFDYCAWQNRYVGCNNGGGGGNFSKVEQLVAKWIGPRKRLFSGFLTARVWF